MRTLESANRKRGNYFNATPEESCRGDGTPNQFSPPDSQNTGVVAVRVHLDDCGPLNGPLRVVPGSHRFGRLADDEVQPVRARLGEVTCIVPQGGALVMRPLLLHASSKVTTPGFRRVLHFLFGPPSLPFGLIWHHSV